MKVYIISVCIVLFLNCKVQLGCNDKIDRQNEETKKTNKTSYWSRVKNVATFYTSSSSNIRNLKTCKWVAVWSKTFAVRSADSLHSPKSATENQASAQNVVRANVISIILLKESVKSDKFVTPQVLILINCICLCGFFIYLFFWQLYSP